MSTIAAPDPGPDSAAPPVAGSSGRRLALELLAASFIVLFQELALIRWLGAQVRVLAYFPNLVLLSAFLGLGIGCLRAGRRSLFWLWPVALLLLAASADALGRVIFTHNAASEHLFLLYYDLSREAPVVRDVRAPIVIFFVLGALSFVPLGQFVAERLRAFREREASLRGYCWDLVGSLLAVLAFTAISFSGAFPVAWFALLLGGGVLLAATRSRAAALGFAAAALAVLAIVVHAERAGSYSPYYALRVVDTGSSLRVLANGSLHQEALPLERGRAVPDGIAAVREGYHLPYRLLPRPPRHALVIGAGTGNDVAVLLDEGAERVDAVEIDPGILRIGQDHPSRPYADRRVRVFNTDARAYLNSTSERYDMIVFGTLDSMTRLSALSNVRLDNFVYTLECLRAAHSRLTPDGGLALFFMVGAEYIDRRLGGMITEVFGEAPLVLAEDRQLFNRIYMAGPAFTQHDGTARRASAAEVLAKVKRQVELPSDDWPYLYLARRGVDSFYLVLIAVFVALSILGVLLASPEMRRTLRQGHGPDWEMFLFGLGFLLLETRSVTAMNLAWSATWLTSAVVFGCILLVVLLATVSMQLRPIRFEAAMAGLLLALGAAWAAPEAWLLASSPLPRLLLSLLFCGLPMFFAAAAFAALFRSRADAGVAFGWNLLGAVAGGLLEMASMAIGLRALLLLAMAGYGAAWLAHRRADASPAP